MPGIEGYPEIIAVTKLPHESVNFGGIWHSDTAYLDEPPMATMLLAREVPPAGGDTMFANMYAAYDALSPALRAMLDPLQAVNSSALADVTKTREDRIRELGPSDRDVPVYEAVHPVVRTHPETGRKALYVNVAHTARFEGMTEEESRPLLQFLFQHQVRPEFTCRFRWSAGSLALWDNRCVQHNPVNDYHGWTADDAPHHAQGRPPPLRTAFIPRGGPAASRRSSRRAVGTRASLPSDGRPGARSSPPGQDRSAPASQRRPRATGPGRCAPS